MQFTTYENLTDEITGQKVSFTKDANQAYRVRITMKEGVTQVKNVFGTTLKKVHTGIGNTLYYPGSTETFNVSKEVVLYFYKSTPSLMGITRVNLGDFLSRLGILHDPLPFFYISDFDKEVLVDSPLFTAPNGILDNISGIKFNGSTFEKGPKIYSDRAMESTPTWPYNSMSVVPSDTIMSNDPTQWYYNAWRPFANCPNLTSIENQGTLGKNLKYVLPCDLTFKNEDGSTSLSAYPTMEGTPTHIINYVMGDKIKISAIPPKLINTTKCTHLYYPLTFNEYILDSIPSNHLPLAGIDLEDKNMKLCSLDLMNMSFTMSIADKKYSDFTISLSHLGIVAPTSVNVCENLHTLHMNISEERPQDIKNNEEWVEWKKSQENHLLTVEDVKKLNEDWGNELERVWLSEHVDNENLIPLFPEGVQRLMGYMNKEFIVNDFIKPKSDSDSLDHINYNYKGKLNGFYSGFSEIQRYMKKNGEPFYFKPKSITLVGERTECVNRYRNLYANTIIDAPIEIPKIQDNLKYLLFYACGMFANSVGLDYKEYYKESKSYTPALFYTKSAVTPDVVVSESNYPGRIVKDENFEDDFFSKIEQANSEYNFACIEGSLDEDYSDLEGYDNILPWGFYNDLVYYAYEGYGDDYFYSDDTIIRQVNSKSDLLNFIYDTGNKQIFLKTHRFKYPVTFEDNNLTGLKASGFFAHQLFYGSNPNLTIGKNVPIVPDTGYNARNYEESFTLNYSEYKKQKPIIITGYFEVDEPVMDFEGNPGTITDAYKWAIMLFFNNYELNEIDNSFAVGEEIINQLPPTRNIYNTSDTGEKVRQMHNIMPQYLIENFEEKVQEELRLLLEEREIFVPVFEFFSPDLNKSKDQDALDRDFVIGLGINSNPLKGHTLKKPSVYTQLLFDGIIPGLYTCNMSDFALRTFSNDTFSEQYVNKNTFNIDGMNTNVYTVNPGLYTTA